MAISIGAQLHAGIVLEDGEEVGALVVMPPEGLDGFDPEDQTSVIVFFGEDMWAYDHDEKAWENCIDPDELCQIRFHYPNAMKAWLEAQFLKLPL